MVNKLNSFADTVVEGSIDFFKKNYVILLFAFLAGLFVYGFDVVNMTFSIDEEANWGSYLDGFIWVTQGRPGVYILSFLLGSPIFSFMAPLVSLMALSIASTLMISHHTSSLRSKIIFVVLAMSYPMYAHMQEFTAQVAYTGIACLFAVLAYKSFAKAQQHGKKIYYLLAIFLLVFTFSIYQSFAFVFFMPLMIDSIINYNERKAKIKSIILIIIQSIVILAIAAVIHFIIFKLILILLSFNATYLSDFIGWGKRPIGAVLSRLVTQFYRFMAGLGSYTALNIVMFITIIVSIIKMKMTDKSKTYIDVLLLILLYIVFLFATFGIMITMGAQLPARAMITMHFFFAAPFYIYFKYSSKFGQMLVILFTIFAVLLNSARVTRLSMSDMFVTDADRMTATRVLDNIYDKAPDFLTGKYKVAFLGFYDMPDRDRVEIIKRQEVFGASFWSWDRGNPDRIIAFLNFYGLPTNIKLANEQEYAQAIRFAEDMPIYPDKDSVAVMGDVVVVKLSQVNR